ncbi:MAG: hypothetical protein OXT72_05920 [Gammaproteobacteria bacterium]|nr:hypothetical protein [Gammaproteobacteria bacterium]MDE0246384.1 hypothetical protein [Gammaproteobacteria bacterium]
MVRSSLLSALLPLGLVGDTELAEALSELRTDRQVAVCLSGTGS